MLETDSCPHVESPSIVEILGNMTCPPPSDHKSQGEGTANDLGSVQKKRYAWGVLLLRDPQWSVRPSLRRCVSASNFCATIASKRKRSDNLSILGCEKCIQWECRDLSHYDHVIHNRLIS